MSWNVSCVGRSMTLQQQHSSQELLEPRHAVVDGAGSLDRAFERRGGSSAVVERRAEERDVARVVAGHFQARAVGVEIVCEKREHRKVLVELAVLRGLMKALARLAPRRADVDDERAPAP